MLIERTKKMWRYHEASCSLSRGRQLPSASELTAIVRAFAHLLCITTTSLHAVARPTLALVQVGTAHDGGGGRAAPKCPHNSLL